MSLLSPSEKQKVLLLTGYSHANRETARDFGDSVGAYYWAREQELLGIEILLAFGDPTFDIAPLKL